MKNMGTSLTILGLALMLCALWLRYQSRRNDSDGPRANQPMNRWQQGVTIDQNPVYSSPSRREVPEKILAEERRQRPEERRN